MVSSDKSPAVQLRSMAGRYVHPLAVGRRVSWPISQVVARPRPSASGDLVEMAAGGELWREPRTARVEAVLFVAREPLGLRKIAQFASLADATEARTLIRRLNQLYDRGGSAFRVEEVASGFQLLSRRKFAGWLRRVQQTAVETRLSSPALETLAVVAYRQPVLRATIESIRGVQCGEMLRQLMERDLVKIVGRSDELGRPFLYGTTRRFLQVFGLRHLDDLPRAQSLRQGAGEISPTASKPSGMGRNDERTTISIDSTEESDVSIAAKSGLLTPDSLEEERRRLLDPLRAEDEDDIEDDDDLDDDDEDEDDDEEEEDEDFEDSDWEEVDDEAEEEEEDDDDWDDDEDDDWDDDEDDDDDDEEEEDWEEE